MTNQQVNIIQVWATDDHIRLQQIYNTLKNVSELTGIDVSESLHNLIHVMQDITATALQVQCEHNKEELNQ